VDCWIYCIPLYELKLIREPIFKGCAGFSIHPFMKRLQNKEGYFSILPSLLTCAHMTIFVLLKWFLKDSCTSWKIPEFILLLARFKLVHTANCSKALRAVWFGCLVLWSRDFVKLRHVSYLGCGGVLSCGRAVSGVVEWVVLEVEWVVLEWVVIMVVRVVREAPVPSQLGVSECTGVGTGVGSVGAAWGGERMAQVRVVSEVFSGGAVVVRCSAVGWHRWHRCGVVFMEWWHRLRNRCLVC